jgi:polyisoprenoid-binding protein YceI
MRPTPLAAVAIAALLMALAASAHAEPEELTIDPGHTFPGFAVRHLGVATQHGRFNRSSGTVTLDLEAGTGSAQIRIETASVDTGNPELDKLLGSRFYFNPAEYPEITYKATRMDFADRKPTMIHGELTFLGQTHPVDLKVEFFGCSRLPFIGNRCGADLTGTFKRSDFGQNAILGFVSDEVTLRIQAEAVKGQAREPGAAPSGAAPTSGN